MSIYATKAELKNTTGVDTTKSSSKIWFSQFKEEVDKIDIEKLEKVPVDVSKPDNVANNNVFKITVCNKLVVKVNNIYTSLFVSKTN